MTCFLAFPIIFLTFPFLPPADNPGTGTGTGKGSTEANEPTGKALVVDPGSIGSSVRPGTVALAREPEETAEVPRDVAIVGVLGLWILITGIGSKISPKALGTG